MRKILFLFSLSIFIIAGCNLQESDSAGGTYVQPSVTRSGKVRKGHVRKNVSTDKNAYKSQSHSKYYYHSRGKYRKKK